MSDDENVDQSAASSTANDTETPTDTTDAGRPSRNDVFAYLEWAALGLCVLLILFAGINVYTSVGAFIATWVAPKFQSAFDAAFNLVVLLAASYGAVVLSRNLASTE